MGLGSWGKGTKPEAPYRRDKVAKGWLWSHQLEAAEGEPGEGGWRSHQGHKGLKASREWLRQSLREGFRQSWLWGCPPYLCLCSLFL